MSKKDFALEAIRSLIVSGEWQPGDIKSENELAARLSVSRSPVRDALAALGQDGLIEQMPQIGVRVRELTDSDYRELFKVRELVEPLAVRELCGNFGGKAYDVLSALIDDMSKQAECENVGKFLEADTEFHSQTAALAEMPFLEGVLKQIGSRVRIYGYISSPDRSRMSEVVDEHKQILHALASRSPEAASAAALRHLEMTKTRLRKPQPS